MRLYGIFTGSCPSGWTRQAAFDDRFLMGYASYDATLRGSTQHRHTINYGSMSTAVFAADSTYSCFDPSNPATDDHSHTITAKNIYTDYGDSTPLHKKVVYCYMDGVINAQV